MNNRIIITNTDKLDKAIDAAEKRARTRKITSKDIAEGCRMAETRMGIFRKYMDGVTISVDMNDQNFPSCYNGFPESTHFDAINRRGKWYVTNIYRSKCRGAEHEVEIKNLYSQAFKQRVEMRNFDHRLSGRNRNFEIFTEASGMVEPGESTFYHPTPRKFFPLMWLDFLRNIDIQIKLFLHIRDKSAPISSICAELLDRRISRICLFSGRYSTFCVMYIGGMNHNRQQTTQHIHYDVPFSAFRFFPRQFLVLCWLLPLSHFGNQ